MDVEDELLGSKTLDICQPSTVMDLLKICTEEKDLLHGTTVHASIVKRGLLAENIFVGSNLVHFYSKCGVFAKAQTVFEELPVQNVVTWTALISGFAQYGHGEAAIKALEEMVSAGLSPDAATFACVLKACTCSRAVKEGEKLHAQIVGKGLCEINVRVANALVCMYAKFGMLIKAKHMFSELPIRNVVSGNAMITGYIQHKDGEEALRCFEWMQAMGLSPDRVTFLCALKACGIVGAACKGQEIHAELVTDGFLEEDIVLGTALVDMYAACNMLAEAHEVFNNLSAVKDVVSWNALIEGYSLVGKDEMVLTLFRKLISNGVNPNLFTFTFLLNTFGYTGQVQAGQMLFEAMSQHYGVLPTLEHQTCMLDLLCRAGNVDNTVAMIKEMPFCADLMVWQTLLDACSKLGNVTFGRWAFQHAILSDENDPAAYVCISNIND